MTNTHKRRIFLAEHEILQEWHPTKNKDLDPASISVGSDKICWWVCTVGHEWDTPVSDRTLKKSACPICKNRRLVVGLNDLLSQNPELAKEWHPSLNGDVMPEDMLVSTTKKAWWICIRNHTFMGVVSERNKGKRSCPYCSGRLGWPGETNIETLYPNVFAQWDFQKNILDPICISGKSPQKAWWICQEGHSYDLDIRDRCLLNLGCPYCSSNRVLEGFNDFASHYPDLLKQWDHVRNTVAPNNIAKHSNLRVWWKCSLNHSWEAVVAKRTLEKRGCPYCAGQKTLKGFNDLESKHPSIAAEWDRTKNALLPSQITSGTRKKAWWVCPKNHSYEMSIVARTNKRNGQCYYCSGQRVLVGFNDLATTHPALCQEWDASENTRTLHDVSFGSVYRAAWKCIQGHVWRTAICNRTQRNPTGCPECAAVATSKIQQAFHKELSKLISDLQCDVRVPVKFKTRSSMAVDMLSDGIKLVIEYDGYYYHSGGRSGRSLASHMAHDRVKTQALVDAGYKVVRIRENGLTHLSMNTDKLLELDYQYGDSMAKIINDISDYAAG